MKEAAQPNAVRQPLLCNQVLESIEDVCYFSRYGFEENASIKPPFSFRVKGCFNSPASPERRGEAMSSGHRGKGAGWYTRLQAALNNKTAIKFAKYLIPTAILLVFLLVSCKATTTLTNDTQHCTRDSNYHASIQRIETHDTIILGYYPSAQPKLSNSKLSNCPIVRISDRKITIRDTVFVSRTDTLLRTQTITPKERYIPPFYRFCTITLATLATFATLAFSIHLLLRYLKIRSPT